ncbi:site-specific DNA-methyltransferase [archaeon]|nr:site-specific DNA-methyltransferase [archaeon]
MKQFKVKNGTIFNGDVLDAYNKWESPICIVSDRPYGIDGYEGDELTPNTLSDAYLPHVEAWTKASNSQTTLWFWCTELGWANVHPILENNGWLYRGSNVWNKGIKHVAGNCNGKTMRKFPTVTEVCVHYVRKEEFKLNDGSTLSIQDWMRNEWKRTGLSFAESNIACGVKNAASRKYFARDHLWYFPPQEEFLKLVDYANKKGSSDGAPYFSIDGINALSKNQWSRIRTKFNFEYGITNVWDCPPLNGKERLKYESKLAHPNQKPLELMKRIILASTDVGDLVWEPFAGTSSASVASIELNRRFLA